MAGYSLAAVRAARTLLAECGPAAAGALLAELAGASRAPARLAETADDAGPRESGGRPGRRPWTPEQKAAAGERMRKRWASGSMKGKVGRKGGKARKTAGSESHG